VTAQDIMTLITTVGFPIVCCGALFWYMIQQSQLHSEESKDMRDAIAALKTSIDVLTTKLEK